MNLGRWRILDWRYVLILAGSAAVLVGLNDWLIHSIESPLRPATSQALGPDFSMRDFTVEAYDPTGQLHYRLSAPAIVNDPLQDRAHITAPKLFFLRAGEQWTLEGERAQVDSRAHQILMAGKVHIRNISRDLTLDTHDLRVQTDHGEGETDRPVRVTQGKNRQVDAVGMRLNVNAGQLTLLSQVKARYAPLVQ